MDAIITINLDNNAFIDNKNEQTELSRILHELADDLFGSQIGNEITIHDIDGNKVGNVVFFDNTYGEKYNEKIYCHGNIYFWK
jgi:hypothetical protein